MEERFPRAHRLRTRREFLRVQEGGARVPSGPLLGLVLKNDVGRTRLGLTVSTRVGSSVVRNSIRRRLREIYRKRREHLPEGIDLVLVARASAAQADFAELQKSYEAIARKLRGMFGGNRDA